MNFLSVVAGKTITTDALLTQRALDADLLDHAAHDVFTVKDNQSTLREDLRLVFDYLRMTESSRRRRRPLPAAVG